MPEIKSVAIIGASGNFGTPITAALCSAGYAITIITRENSTTQHPAHIPLIRTPYTLPSLTSAFKNQDAVICVVGPGGIGLQTTFIAAAEAAGVYRFVLDDFGWGEEVRGLPEFDTVQEQRKGGWGYARGRADANPGFTWSGVSSGNPIDWALRKFPLMGFDVAAHEAVIYDDGTEMFTGTTLEGIEQSVLGIMRHPQETANRFLKVRSIHICQNELLEAFQSVTDRKWEVRRSTTEALMESGRAKYEKGEAGWVLDLVVAQLFDFGQARCVVAETRGEADSELLGVKVESARDVVVKALA
ncbi:hypothetical protein BDV97DRAFT_86219 [Delphinella strobiligena]|nr:hypothetical protein BDV97DRAFT_86219 [Delphinella strobiligena]